MRKRSFSASRKIVERFLNALRMPTPEAPAYQGADGVSRSSVLNSFSPAGLLLHRDKGINGANRSKMLVPICAVGGQWRSKYDNAAY